MSKEGIKQCPGSKKKQVNLFCIVQWVSYYRHSFKTIIGSHSSKQNPISMLHDEKMCDEVLLFISYFLSKKFRVWDTQSHFESFIESEVPHLRLFLILSMMPLKRWVATAKVLTVLLRNKVQSIFLCPQQQGTNTV